MYPPNTILAETPTYQIQNFAPPVRPGGNLREGGKFHPIKYSSPQDLRDALVPEEFREVFNLPSERAGEESVVERVTVGGSYGTGNRRVYKGPPTDEGQGKKGKGSCCLGGVDGCREEWRVLCCLLGTDGMVGYMSRCA